MGTIQPNYILATAWYMYNRHELKMTNRATQSYDILGCTQAVHTVFEIFSKYGQTIIYGDTEVLYSRADWQISISYWKKHTYYFYQCFLDKIYKIFTKCIKNKIWNKNRRQINKNSVTQHTSESASDRLIM